MVFGSEVFFLCPHINIVNRGMPVLFILGILASLYPYLSSAKKKTENGVFPSKLGSKFCFLCPIDFFLSFF